MAELLKDKVAVITGAGRGIGKGEAISMASQGAKVVVNDFGGGARWHREGYVSCWWSSRGNQESTYIFLENNKYDEYPGVRIFLDYEEMRDKKHITYTFKEGILGLRVMTEYEFNP